MQRMTYFSAYFYKLSFPDSAECVKNSFTAEYCKNYFLLFFCVVVFFADAVVPVFAGEPGVYHPAPSPHHL